MKVKCSSRKRHYCINIWFRIQDTWILLLSFPWNVLLRNILYFEWKWKVVVFNLGCSQSQPVDKLQKSQNSSNNISEIKIDRDKSWLNFIYILQTCIQNFADSETENFPSLSRKPWRTCATQLMYARLSIWRIKRIEILAQAYSFFFIDYWFGKMLWRYRDIAKGCRYPWYLKTLFLAK